MIRSLISDKIFQLCVNSDEYKSLVNVFCLLSDLCLQINQLENGCFC